jgi:hypothetical protein
MRIQPIAEFSKYGYVTDCSGTYIIRLYFSSPLPHGQLTSSLDHSEGLIWPVIQIVTLQVHWQKLQSVTCPW